MTDDRVETSFFGELARELRQLWRAFSFRLSSTGAIYRNSMRRLRRRSADYVVIPLSGSLPERAGPPRGFWQRRLPLPNPPLSMEVLNYQLQAVADADNVKGVVFVFQGLSVGLATAQSIRSAFLRLRQSGKKCIVFTPYLDLVHYLSATAADQIVVPPMSRFEMLGMRTEAIFLRDVLGRLGIEADVIQISPFKTAYNELGESDITPEQEEQLNWILDDAYDQVTAAIAAGRQKSPEEIKELIDRAPMSAESALAAGLIDHIAYEDTLPYLLAQEEPSSASGKPAPDNQSRNSESGVKRERPKARLVTWPEARSILLEKTRRPTRRYVGVVSLEGRITMGASRSSPFPIPLLADKSSGEYTLTSLLRRAEKDPRLAALVVHIDSGGGSALASDLIWRQLDRLGKRVPVVAYMGNVAASGGYYVAAAARHILSQPLTLTGSIGVVTVHITTKGLFEQLSIKRVAISRGERANLDSDAAPLSDDDRQLLWSEISDTYERFKGIVASARDLDLDGLDEICEGRVWTGRQAQEKKLVDGHGDIQDAIDRAAELAGLATDDQSEVIVRNLYQHGDGHVLPTALEDPTAFLETFTRENLTKQIETPLLVMPVEITLR